MDDHTRPFDFIVFGATGFTGKYCVFHAPKIFSGYKWAVAGRSRTKLDEMLREIGIELGADLSAVPIVLADVKDARSLAHLSQQCRVLINCCGPFLMYGEPVVQACIETVTDYVDVTAEPQFMEAMQLRHHTRAQQQQVYSVSACGFDSLLAEMGMIFAEENFYKGTMHSTSIYITVRDEGPLLGSMLNYGTWHSMVPVFSKKNKKELDEIRKQQTPFEWPEPKLKKRIVHRSPVTGNWYVPFANVDQGVAKRTQRHWHDTQKKRPVQMREYYDLGRTWIVPALAVIGASFLYLITRFEFGVKLLLNYPYIFSLGHVSKEAPKREKYSTSHFRHTFHSKGWLHGESMAERPTHELVTVVSGMNPAYGATCVCLLLSALTLATERDAIPGR